MKARRSLLWVAPLTLFAFACSEVDSDPVGPSADAADLNASPSAAVMTPSPKSSSPKNFIAPLDPDQEVPPVDSRATGTTHFRLSEDGSEMSYRLNVGNIEDVMMAHIHMASRGENGPVVVWLYPSPTERAPELIPGRTGGTLATGVITDADVIGPLDGAGLDGLLDAIKAGNTYVNVHTTANPPGEIRGQIRAPGLHLPEAAPTATYDVTIENLTSQGQPFTPPLVVLHRGGMDLFTAGEPATFELKEIAENGNLDPMLGAIGATRHVSSFAVGATPPVPPLEPGESVTVTVEAKPGSEFVSVVSMLICTNDGFTGIDAAHLPTRVDDEWEAYTGAYDAGTEMNTEDFADLVPPCPMLTGVDTEDSGTGSSDPALVEGGVIHHHAGIDGDADLDPEIHGWVDPVARIHVKRTD